MAPGNYFPKALPLLGTTKGRTLCMWPVYVVHFLTLTFSAQNLVMPSINSSFVWGLTAFRKKCFSSCQTNSIGLRSGDLGSVFHQLMLLSSVTTEIQSPFSRNPHPSDFRKINPGRPIFHQSWSPVNLPHLLQSSPWFQNSKHSTRVVSILVRHQFYYSHLEVTTQHCGFSTKQLVLLASLQGWRLYLALSNSGLFIILFSARGTFSNFLCLCSALPVVCTPLSWVSMSVAYKTVVPWGYKINQFYFLTLLFLLKLWIFTK